MNNQQGTASSSSSSSSTAPVHEQVVTKQKRCRELVGYIHSVASKRNYQAMKILQGHNYPKLEPWPEDQQPTWGNASHYVLRHDYTKLVDSVDEHDFVPNLKVYISKHAETWAPYAVEQRPIYRAAADTMCNVANELINFLMSVDALESLNINIANSNDAYDLLEYM
jgi:hypothetical protein